MWQSGQELDGLLGVRAQSPPGNLETVLYNKIDNRRCIPKARMLAVMLCNPAGDLRDPSRVPT